MKASTPVWFLLLVALTSSVFAQNVGRRDVVFGKVVSVEGKTVVADVRDFVNVKKEYITPSTVQVDGNDVPGAPETGAPERRVRIVDMPGQKRIRLSSKEFRFQSYGRSAAKKQRPVTLDVTQIKPGTFLIILKNSESGASEFYRKFLRDDVLIAMAKQRVSGVSSDANTPKSVQESNSSARSRGDDE